MNPSSSDMLYYYENLLPFRSIFQWLNHSPAPQEDFTRREFAFEFKSGAYQRYNSFQTQKEFKDAVVKANPTRFEVGAVYNLPPNKRKTLAKNVLKPLSKELVFDIDLTDYDEVRTCCEKTAICEKCWKFIVVAIKIVNVCLTQDFGFQNLVWVFSGRRGVHCWISDARARNLNDQQRRAIIEYLSVVKSGKILRQPFHPHLERSFQILKENFVDIVLTEQDPWSDDQKATEELVKPIPDSTLQSELTRYWTETPARSSLDKWADLDAFVKKGMVGNKQITSFMQDFKRTLIFQTLYPRLDVEVSRQIIHLLKSPFCVHPGTGNICVPFAADQDFSPFDAPNLKGLLEERECGEKSTSLAPYVDFFQDFVNKLLRDEPVKRKREDLEF